VGIKKAPTGQEIENGMENNIFWLVGAYSRKEQGQKEQVKERRY